MLPKNTADLTPLSEEVKTSADNIGSSEFLTALTTLQTQVKGWHEKVEAAANSEKDIFDAMDDESEEDESDYEAQSSLVDTLNNARDGLEEVVDRLEQLKRCLTEDEVLAQVAQDLSDSLEA
jgi:Tfp pilus assembly protein PilO